MKKLSVVTINFNNAIGLRKTVESVMDQTFKDFEYIIIDGGSTDGSVEIIERYEDRIDYWISEPDKGIYNALNKGIDKVKGEYIYFLNSGDAVYDSHVFENIIDQLNDQDIIYGDIFIDGTEKQWTKNYPDELSFTYFLTDGLPHSSGAFIRKDAFRDDLKYYDENLKIVADRKWFMIAIFKKNYSYKYLSKTLGKFEYGNGLSSKLENRSLLLLERQLVLDTEFKNIKREIEFLNQQINLYKNAVGHKWFRYYNGIRRLLKKRK